MALQGTLREFSATEILQLLATQRKTGCLVLEHAAMRACVYVLDGGIVSLQAESDRDLEDLIVRGRYMEAEELGGLIERQILDDLATMIEWTEGRYGFEAERRWPHPIVV